MKPKDIFKFIKVHTDNLSPEEKMELANMITGSGTIDTKPTRKKKPSQDDIPSVEWYKQQLEKYFKKAQERNRKKRMGN